MNNTINGEVQAVAHDNIERTMSGLKDGVATATAGVEQVQANVDEGMRKAMKTAEDMAAFTQGNLEAVARSGQILAAGMQEMAQAIAATMRASLDETMNAAKAMATVKSPKEAMELQASLLRSMVERTVSQTSQLTDSGMKLSERAAAPIAARLSLATQTFGRVG